MRKIIKVKDIVVLFGKQPRRAAYMLAEVRTHYGKEKHQPVTLCEFAAYYGIPLPEVEETVRYNDAHSSN